MCTKNHAKKHAWVSIKTHFNIFVFIFVNENIDEKLSTHVKNHQHHMNFLISIYSIFFTQMLFM
jgi:hypothetical protein